MEIYGEQIEYRTDNRLAIARDSVLVLRNDLRATSDLLEYDREEGWAVLTGSPKIIRGQEIMQGDKISLFFQGGNINQVLVNDHAYTEIPADTLGGDRMNWMRGETMNLTLVDGQLHQAVITGQAEALYYPLEEGKQQGANRVSGDKITLWTRDGEVKRIKVSGGTEGTYYPERMAHRASR
jgi:lipopolysaccharide export system protein LptA